MNSRRWMMIVAALALMAPSVRADLADLKRTFDELLPGMGQEQAQQQWQEICWNAGAPGHEAERSRACRLMAEKLGPGTPEPARVWLLKQLERIGRGECVEQVTAVVCDNDRLVRDAAIRRSPTTPTPRPATSSGTPSSPLMMTACVWRSPTRWASGANRPAWRC